MRERFGKILLILLTAVSLVRCSGFQSEADSPEADAGILSQSKQEPSEAFVPPTAAAASAPTEATIAAEAVRLRTLFPADPTPTPSPAATLTYNGPAVSRSALFLDPSSASPDPKYQYCLAMNQQCLDRIPGDVYKVEAVRGCNIGFDSCMIDESCEAKLGACGFSGKNVYQCAREKKECDCEAARLKCYSRGEDTAACYHDYNRCLI